MNNANEQENARRQFLRYGLTIASGIVVPLGLTGCEQDERARQQATVQTFVQPPMLEAKNGVLEVTLTISYFDTLISGAQPNDRHPVSLRAYGYDAQRADYAGPTLVVRGGDTLRIRLLNQLPENPPFRAFRDPTNFIKPNLLSPAISWLKCLASRELDVGCDHGQRGCGRFARNGSSD